MILQALNSYYRRKCDDPDPAQRLPAFGLEQKEIPFILEITATGELVQLRDTRTPQGKKKVAQSFRVPQGVKKTSGVAANLLWDTLEYVLGVDTKGKPERVVEQHTAFVQRIALLPVAAQADTGIQAVRRFLEREDKAPQLEQLQSLPAWAELLEINPVLSFQLHGDLNLVCQRPAVVQAALNVPTDGDERQAMCLVSGQFAPVERLHTAIKGVWGAQTSGANIVSFNARAFESYGKTERQGENAPVSKAAAFAYTTALNHLLRKDSPQRIQVGDASTVFWADQDSEFESLGADVFGEPSKDDPDRGTRAVHALLSAVQAGKFAEPEDNRFHILGLAPNAARISIRFYHCLPLPEMAQRITQHFKDLEMVRGLYDQPYPSLFRLLTAVALQNKADNIPPNLGGAIVDAIFAGPDVPYPAMWLNTAVGRSRAEQNVTYLRAAAIKACLNRHIRRSTASDQAHPISTPLEKEFLPMLDLDNTSPAYRLGRLFAALERIQEAAAGGPGQLNATIRDRYYGAASSTPVAVFTTLLRLKNAHLKKLTIGQSVNFEKLLAEILGPVTDFPAHLSLPDQGRFALGYYHQRQAFFTKSEPQNPTEE
ncbi:MAG: type I-C CRISPR-associated protein Cas8c/Csd1 [Hydrogenophaga sp.]|uniref:type I-C CRISPR-associated protein Cas8c/Csd1 n=1 Tax=Hydrogenophaga sp. TaxID=1904254 RepID=UPI002ABB2165|nr:type I-C CRISPR-associated protein Cas8c/Csd1 [Hydrogenophaga sp.]MDZ4186512.1 type I-C CRISPR-associated protein Cas8c/Csd1 [Hydrogenophaga sp.]